MQKHRTKSYNTLEVEANKNEENKLLPLLFFLTLLVVMSEIKNKMDQGIIPLLFYP
jgi:hypothetical protein